MIYITEMAFPNDARRDDWHAFYLTQIANLQTVPGFIASQRFQALHPMDSPFTTLHEVTSGGVFESDIYKRKGGRASNGDFQPEMTHWHRNLYDGVPHTPDVADGRFLVYVDAPREVAERDMALPAGLPMQWLTLCGLDRTIPHRGMAIVEEPGDLLERARQDKRIRVFKPFTARISKGRP